MEPSIRRLLLFILFAMASGFTAGEAITHPNTQVGAACLCLSVWLAIGAMFILIRESIAIILKRIEKIEKR